RTNRLNTASPDIPSSTYACSIVRAYIWVSRTGLNIFRSRGLRPRGPPTPPLAGTPAPLPPALKLRRGSPKRLRREGGRSRGAPGLRYGPRADARDNPARFTSRVAIPDNSERRSGRRASCVL